VDRTEKSNDVSVVDHNGTDSIFAICPLQWGTALGKNIQQQKSNELEDNDNLEGSKLKNSMDWLLQAATYETVLATDVLYDIEALKPLLQTASDLLIPETGHFVLSHVPRASISSSSGDNNDDDVVSSREVLEAAICSEAARHDLQWLPQCTIRPEQLMKLHGRTESVVSQNHSLKDMDEAGAAILIFQKRAQSDVQLHKGHDS
jgi:2-polyprenyl-3-methyl-5-hydroxy-6-metoxy-1,4-benzoquinol methylase